MPGAGAWRGPAAGARLDRAAAIVLDRHGHVYIADVKNERVRMVDASGTISTVVGVGEKGAGVLRRDAGAEEDRERGGLAGSEDFLGIGLGTGVAAGENEPVAEEELGGACAPPSTQPPA